MAVSVAELMVWCLLLPSGLRYSLASLGSVDLEALSLESLTESQIMVSVWALQVPGGGGAATGQ